VRLHGIFNKEVAGNGTHGIQNSRVGNPARYQLLLNHPLTVDIKT
jgi:hypothetical protein